MIVAELYIIVVLQYTQQNTVVEMILIIITVEITFCDTIVTYRKQDRDMTIDMLVKFQTRHVTSRQITLCYRNVISTVVEINFSTV